MNTNLTGWDDTIVAVATPPGVGALGVIRLSGTAAISIANELFTSKNLMLQQSHTLHVGLLHFKNEILDEVVASLYVAPKSYTGEHVVEFSCHGSPYVQQQVINACIQLGARLAKPGEFTQRAFLNGKLDLVQAESVADLIAAETAAVHNTALQQMKGGFSSEIKILREQLINFAALVELELDFGEEDVEFADRAKLQNLVSELLLAISKLIKSFELGNILKNGVTAVIAGRPNAGKSTLLNAMLNEERAIVTNIAGTTRDTIEERLVVNGIVFRLIDTAGLREATDVIEKIGIEKSIEKINTANILIYVFDAENSSEIDVLGDLKLLGINGQQVLLVANKTDLCHHQALGMLNYSINEMMGNNYPIFEISALEKKGVQNLIEYLPAMVLTNKIDTNQTIVVNARHHQSLKNCELALLKVQTGLNNHISGDILALDIRQALLSLGEITGEILHDKDILGTIFGKFCIGK
jgi:tRNA modification GTPase